MIHYSSYFWLNALLAALSLQSDRWIVGALGTPHEIGIYASMIMIATFPVTLIESLANQFLVPVIFERVGAAVPIRFSRGGAYWASYWLSCLR